jgi:penicillin-binding protein 1C
MGFFVLMVLSLCVFVFIVFTYWSYADGLIIRERLVNRQFQGLIMYDKDSEVIFESGVQFRTGNVPIGKVPLTLRNATVAVEDKDFYKHVGFSFPSMIRAFFANTEEGQIVQGASTITQQLVKNALLGDTSTRYVRKLREVILAFAIEYRYSKDEILELYINSIYYGRGAWGVGDASLQYFGKDVENLTDNESIFLAGLPQAPSVYGANIGKAKARQRLVANAMIQQGYIDSQQATSIVDTSLMFVEPRHFSVEHPFFTIHVREELFNLISSQKLQLGTALSSYNDDDVQEFLIGQGLRVYTTFDPRIQELGESSVKSGVDELSDRNVTNGAALILESSSGAIRGMVGSKGWFDNSIDGKVNVLYTLQQPGSTLKPFIFAAALQQGVISTSTLFDDRKKSFNGYSPVNYDGKFRGSVTLKRALANSLNIPAVEAFNMLGVDRGVEYLTKMGFGSLRKSLGTDETYATHYGLSLVLGGYEVQPAEVVAAYGVLARGGQYKEPYVVEKVVNRFGQVIYQRSNSGVEVLRPDVINTIFDILSDNEARKETFGSRASNLEIKGKKVAVKTGTTDDYRDSWAVGYDSRYVVGVWVGNNDNTSMAEVAGSVGGASVWKRIFEGL